MAFRTCSTILALATLAFGFPQALVSRASDLSAFDISSPQSSSFWSCAGKKYQKVVIRGYQQACSVGGQVDPNFLASYKAAKAAGINNVDAYFFPCTGTTGGVGCKSPQAQVSAFTSYLKQNNVNVGYIWFDLEPATEAQSGCNSWQMGDTENESTAKTFATAMKSSGYKWGVYANGNTWPFASRDTDIASDLPFWAVQDDGTPGVSTVKTFCGGWTTAFGKQYSLDTKDPTCGGSLDLDSFLSSNSSAAAQINLKTKPIADQIAAAARPRQTIDWV